MRLPDPSLVRAEYADESRLAVRKRAHERGEGPDAREIVVAAVRDARPSRVLEVGCGEGELAERLLRRRCGGTSPPCNGLMPADGSCSRVRAYVDSMLYLEGTVVPEVDGPIRVRRTPSVFVCTK